MAGPNRKLAAALVRKTAFAAADGENAPLMSCIKISLGPDGLRGVSTNGFCIMEAKGEPPRSSSISKSLSFDSLDTMSVSSRASITVLRARRAARRQHQRLLHYGG